MKRQTKIFKTALKRGNKVNPVYLISKLFIATVIKTVVLAEINTNINGIKETRNRLTWVC